MSLVACSENQTSSSKDQIFSCYLGEKANSSTAPSTYRQKRRPHLLPPGINSGRKHAFPQPAQSIVGTLQHHSPTFAILQKIWRGAFRNCILPRWDCHWDPKRSDKGARIAPVRHSNGHLTAPQMTPHSGGDVGGAFGGVPQDHSDATSGARGQPLSGRFSKKQFS